MVLELEQVGALQNGLSARKSGPWRWTVEQYEQAAQLGWFEDRRVELINGEILAMNPMGEPHAVGTTNITYVFIRKLPNSLRVRAQMPLYVNQSSEPEPDIAVVDASLSGQRPTTARLVVEVSDSTLRSDRTTKAALYASAQIAEYWIVDVNARTLEVLREPVEDSISPSGWRYGQTQLLRETASVAPLCAPDVSFLISELLP